MKQKEEDPSDEGRVLWIGHAQTQSPSGRKYGSPGGKELLLRDVLTPADVRELEV
jgi:hypothetical protein